MVNQDTFSDFRGSIIPPWIRPWRKRDKQVNQLRKLIYQSYVTLLMCYVLKSYWYSFQSWNRIGTEPLIIIFIYSFMKVKFPYQYIQSTCVLFRNIRKTFAWKYAKNTKIHTEFI